MALDRTGSGIGPSITLKVLRLQAHHLLQLSRTWRTSLRRLKVLLHLLRLTTTGASRTRLLCLKVLLRLPSTTYINFYPFQSLTILSTALLGLKVLLQFLHLPASQLLDFKVLLHFLHLVTASYLNFKVYLDLMVLL